VPYVEPLSDARTPLADFFRILLDDHTEGEAGMHDFALDDSTSTANEQYLD
jgi:hypothetical protein